MTRPFSPFTLPPLFPLPTVAAVDPVAGARAIAGLLPAAIARAEAADLPEVVRLLQDALRRAERLAQGGVTN